MRARRLTAACAGRERLCELLGPAQRLVEVPPVGDPPVEQPEAVGAFRVHGVAGEQHRHGGPEADQARQRPRRAAGRHEAVIDVVAGELGARGGQAQVAGEGEVEAGAERKAVHGGDGDLGRRGEPVDDLLERLDRGLERRHRAGLRGERLPMVSRSAPAQKPSPAPCSTMTCACGSRAASLTRASSSFRQSRSSALRRLRPVEHDLDGGAVALRPDEV